MVDGIRTPNLPSATTAASVLVNHDAGGGAMETRRVPLADFANQLADEDAFGALGNFVTGAGATAIVTAGDPAYAPETTTFKPNGTRVTNAFANLVNQLNFDNIVLAWMETATVTITNGSPAIVTWAAHPASAGDLVVFSTTGALPTGLTAGTKYYVIAAGLGTNGFRVSATAGGAAINTSSAGSGVHTARLVVNDPGITWKVPDYDLSYGGAAHALVSLGAAIGSGEVSIFAGADGPFDGAHNMKFGIYSVNSAGAAQQRMSFAHGDNNAIGIGVDAMSSSSEKQGSWAHFHGADGNRIAGLRLTNGATGLGSTDGGFIGLWDTENIRVWQYENLSIIFGANNTQVAEFNPTTGAIFAGAITMDGNLRISDSTGQSIYGYYASATNHNYLKTDSPGGTWSFGGGTTSIAEWLKIGAAAIEPNCPVRLKSYTVGTLPAGSVGDLAYATDARKNGEGGGSGTGTFVFKDASAWRSLDNTSGRIVNAAA